MCDNRGSRDDWYIDTLQETIEDLKKECAVGKAIIDIG